MKTTNWEKEWVRFVKEKLLPARYGFLRFELKSFISSLLEEEQERMMKILTETKWEKDDTLSDWLENVYKAIKEL